MKTKNKKLNMYTLELSLRLLPELLEKWCQIKGYSTVKQQFNPSTNKMEEIENTETKEEFFERHIRTELLNVAIVPIQNVMIQEANQYAQKQIEDLKKMADDAMSVKLTKE